MAFDSKKTILLEKTYLYVRASLGFQLEGTSTEKIPTNNGFYRFFVDNLQKSIGNSYVNILYDSQDLTLQCFCSELYMDELMSSDSSAIEDVVEELKKNTTTIVEFENGVSSALEANHQDNVAITSKIEEFESGVSAGMASNHEDNVAIHTLLDKLNFSTNVTNDPLFGISSKTLSSILFSKCPINSYNKPYLRYYLNPDDFTIDVDGSAIYCKSFYGLGYSQFRFLTYIPRLFEFKYTVDYDIININSNIYSLTTLNQGSVSSSLIDNYSLLPMNDFLQYVLSLNAYLRFNRVQFNKLISFSRSVKYSRSSYFSKKLILCSVDGFDCVLNQDFDYDFEKGYLDFSFYSSLDISLLNQMKLRFLTDVGSVDFLCSDLNFVKISDSSVPLIPAETPLSNSSIFEVIATLS